MENQFVASGDDKTSQNYSMMYSPSSLSAPLSAHDHLPSSVSFAQEKATLISSESMPTLPSAFTPALVPPPISSFASARSSSNESIQPVIDTFPMYVRAGDSIQSPANEGLSSSSVALPSTERIDDDMASCTMLPSSSTPANTTGSSGLRYSMRSSLDPTSTLIPSPPSHAAPSPPPATLTTSISSTSLPSMNPVSSLPSGGSMHSLSGRPLVSPATFASSPQTQAPTPMPFSPSRPAPSPAARSPAHPAPAPPMHAAPSLALTGTPASSTASAMFSPGPSASPSASVAVSAGPIVPAPSPSMPAPTRSSLTSFASASSHAAAHPPTPAGPPPVAAALASPASSVPHVAAHMHLQASAPPSVPVASPAAASVVASAAQGLSASAGTASLATGTPVSANSTGTTATTYSSGPSAPLSAGSQASHSLATSAAAHAQALPVVVQQLDVQYSVCDLLAGRVTVLAPEWTHPPHVRVYRRAPADMPEDVLAVSVAEACALGRELPQLAWTQIAPTSHIMGACAGAAARGVDTVMRCASALVREEEVEAVPESKDNTSPSAGGDGAHSQRAARVEAAVSSHAQSGWDVEWVRSVATRALEAERDREDEAGAILTTLGGTDVPDAAYISLMRESATPDACGQCAFAQAAPGTLVDSALAPLQALAVSDKLRALGAALGATQAVQRSGRQAPSLWDVRVNMQALALASGRPRGPLDESLFGGGSVGVSPLTSSRVQAPATTPLEGADAAVLGLAAQPPSISVSSAASTPASPLSPASNSPQVAAAMPQQPSPALGPASTSTTPTPLSSPNSRTRTRSRVLSSAAMDTTPVHVNSLTGALRVSTASGPLTLPHTLTGALSAPLPYIDDERERDREAFAAAAAASLYRGVNMWALPGCPDVRGVAPMNVFLYQPLPPPQLSTPLSTAGTGGADEEEPEDAGASVAADAYESSMELPEASDVASVLSSASRLTHIPAVATGKTRPRKAWCLYFPTDTTALLARIFSFLTLKELYALVSVSKSFYIACRLAIHSSQIACLDQLWFLLGTKRSLSCLTRAPRFYSAHSVSLNFCNLVDGDFLLSLLSLMYDSPCKRSQLMSLSLYYCYKLTDAHLQAICALYPNIRDLNIGRCILLTDQCLPALAALPHLRKLVVSNASNFTRALTYALYQPHAFPSLRLLEAEGLSVGPAGVIGIEEIAQARVGLRVVTQRSDLLWGKRKDGKKSMESERE